MIGQTLAERYQIKSELGRGGMGVVYEAWDSLLERAVALKLVTEPGLGTEGRNRLLREARATAGLSHRHIVAIYDVGEAVLPGATEKSSFIVMEQIEGVSLRKRMPSTLEGAVEIGRQICAALQAAHERGIIHGDLKPENILLTGGGEAKLMDFGLAQSIGGSRVPHEPQIAGTVGYLAPEVISGQPPTHRSDLYALGVTLYEMFTGRPVFESEELTGLLSQHLIASVVLPSVYNQAIPPTLESMVVQLLRKRPEDRPVSAVRVGEALINWRDSNGQPATSLDEFTLLDRMARGRLIGRGYELGQARTLWDRARSGEGRILLVTGEPGIGKTRLARELTTLAEVSGGRAFSSAGYQGEGPPYAILGQIVHTALTRAPKPELPPRVISELFNLAPALRLRYPDLPDNEGLDPQAEQFRLYDCLVTLLEAISRDGPILLFLDDIHWADSASLALLTHLSRQIHQLPALMVGTYRETELAAAPALRRLLRTLTQERLAARIKLKRLNRAATTDLLSSLLVGEVSPAFVDSVYRETEGNPFFIEEVCKTLAENGRLRFEDGRWQIAGPTELEIPQGVMVAVQARLEHFSEEERRILQLAALAGRHFDYELLLTAADAKESFVESTLVKAQKAQLIEEDQGEQRFTSTKPTFSFAHALIHSGLLTSIGPFRRQRWQRRVALAMEATHADRLAELAPLLGRYFGEAGEAEKAVHYLTLAGDEARRVYAYSEAVKAYEQALVFLEEQGDDHLEARTRIKLGLTHQNLFEFDRARRAFERGFALWKRPDQSLAGHDRADGQERILRLHLQEPRTIDPARASDGLSETFVRQMFRGLVELGPDGELWPDLADSWEILDGGRRYLFRLRDDSRWTDGRPVTARDFEGAWKRALAPVMGNDPARALYDIRGAQAFNTGKDPDPDHVGIQAIDDFTLLVELERPISYFLQLLTRGVALSAPDHVVAAHGERWTDPERIVVNGPFQLDRWIDGQRIELVWNQSYQGRFDGNLDRIVFITDPEAPFLELYETENLDALTLNSLTSGEGERARRRYIQEYVTLPYAYTSYYAFDTSRPPFDRPLVRRALAKATDRALLANLAGQGTYFPASGGFVPPGMLGHTPEAGLAYDPVEARELLAEAGFPGGKDLPTVEVLAIRHGQLSAYREALFDLWQENLGLVVECQELWFSEFLEQLERQRPAIWFTGWAADYPDPDNFLRVCVARERTGWVHDEYRRIVEQARRIGDVPARLEAYRRAETILAQEAPIVPVFYSRHHLLLKPRVRCYPLPAVGGLSMKDVCVVGEEMG